MKTLGQMVEEVWESLGEPSDLDPGDWEASGYTTSVGFRRIARILNDAQVALASWKDPRSGRRLRWNNAVELKGFQVGMGTTVGLVGATSTAAVLTVGDASLYEGMIVQVGSEFRYVIATAGTSVYLSRALSAAPATGASVVFYPVSIELGGGSVVQRVVDGSSQVTLQRASMREFTVPITEETGDPVYWTQVGSKLFAWPVAVEARWLQVLRARQLTTMSVVGDVPELPEQFHRPMVLWALAVGFEREMEPADQRELYSQLVSVMATVQFPEDSINDGEDGKFTIDDGR